MLIKSLYYFKKALRDCKGSITVEASIVLPFMFLILFGLIFFSMYIFQKLNLLDAAVYTAKQRAATWDSSRRNIEDGYQTSTGDGLYWRVFSDLGGSLTVEDAAIKGQGGASLVRNKNSAAGSFLLDRINFSVLKPSSTRVLISYKNMLIRKTVQVDIRQKTALPLKILLSLLSSDIGAKSEADVVEPAEFIRSVDLAVSYAGPLLDKLGNYLDKFNTDGQTQPGVTKIVASTAAGGGQRVKVYHYSDCMYVSRIKPGNLIEFTSVDEAGRNGYYLCAECAKRLGN